MIWGKSPVDYRVPAALDFPAFTVFSTNYPAYKMFMLVVSMAIFAALLVVHQENPHRHDHTGGAHPSAYGGQLGHNVGRVFMLVFGFGTALAGLAGVIAGPSLVTSPTWPACCWARSCSSWWWSAGWARLPGAFIASLLIGLLQTFAVSINGSLASVFGPLGPGRSALLADIWNVSIAQIAPILPYRAAGSRS